MKYVVLGASAAGINGAETLRKLDAQAEIVLISEDQRVYSRCILHHYLSGSRTEEELSFAVPDFFKKNRIRWLEGKTVIRLDVQKKEVLCLDGQTVAYDKLLIATGSSPYIPPVTGVAGAENMIPFRTLEHTHAIKKAAKAAKEIVVLGGGLAGIDAVTGLLGCEAHLTVVELQERMLSQQLDAFAAGVYEKAFAAKGVTQHYGTAVSEAVREGNRITALRLDNGLQIPCDLLIVASGARANVEFLKESGVHCDKYGLVINPLGQTNAQDIYGAGDVTGRGPIWSVAVKESIVAASNMAGVPMKMTDFFAGKATMNFLGIPTMSIGLSTPPDESFQVEIEKDRGNYKKIIHKEGKIYGAILQGDLSYAGVLTQLIQQEIDVSRVKKPLFRIDYSDFFSTTRNFEFTYDT